MKYISTRGQAPAVSFEEVVLTGLAPDGGLYIPASLPAITVQQLQAWRQLSYAELAFEIIRLFVDGAIPDNKLRVMINESYAGFSNSEVAPLRHLDNNNWVLELYCGPTLAFKDFALQLLGRLLDFFLEKRQQYVAILGATSGDTGSAALEGCKHCKYVELFILHPHNRVSEVQRRQMTTVSGDNINNLAIDGNFDDCQQIVKQAFSDQSFLPAGYQLVAVNSINWARIMAQIVYYFYAALRLGASEKNPVSFSVPTGNFGDIYAGFLAKKMGLNINKLIIATNENDILARFLKSNDYSKSEMVETISPSMNIQVSSNFERLLFDGHKAKKMEEEMPKLMKEFEQTGSLKVSEEVLKSIQKEFSGFVCDDEKTKNAIKEFFIKTGETLDPHSAIGVFAAEEFFKTKEYQGELLISLATAHPAKFPEAVMSAGAPNPQLPSFLKDLSKRKEEFAVIENNLESVKNFISEKI